MEMLFQSNNYFTVDRGIIASFGEVRFNVLGATKQVIVLEEIKDVTYYDVYGNIESIERHFVALKVIMKTKKVFFNEIVDVNGEYGVWLNVFDVDEFNNNLQKYSVELNEDVSKFYRLEAL